MNQFGMQQNVAAMQAQQAGMFGMQGGNVPGGYANFDGQLGAVSRYNTVLAPIPEPSSVVLLGLAACGFLRRRR